MNSLIFKIQDSKFDLVNDEYTILEFMELIKTAVLKNIKDVLNN
jgi:hypothetical protein